MVSSCKLRCRVLVWAAGIPLSLSAHAATVNWINAAGGSMGTPGNWSTGVLPGPTDALRFGLASTYTVTSTPSVANSQLLTVGAGSVTFAFLAPHTSETLTIGVDNVTSAAVTIAGGNLDLGTPAGGGAFVGMIGGVGSGTLTVAGPTASLHALGAGQIVVGAEGTGRMFVQSGAAATSAGRISIGLLAGSNGAVTVEGAGSTFVTTNSNSDVTVGESGVGAITVQSGGSLASARDFYVAQNSSSSGTVNIQTSGTSGTASIARDCSIGRNSSAGSAAGTGTFTVSGSATATITGTTSVGDPDGGTGTLSVQGGTYTTRNLALDATHGVLDLQNGVLAIAGGVFSPVPGNFVINPSASGRTPTLQLSGGASTTISASSTLCSSSNRAARLEVLSGSSFNTTTSLTLGAVTATGSSATALVDGASSSLQVGTSLFVGSGGSAQLDVSGGAHVNCVLAQIAPNSGASGTVNFAGTGTVLAATNSLDIGGAASVTGGVGHLNLSNNAAATVGTTTNLYIGSTLLVDHATITCGGTLTASGALTLNGGTITAPTLAVANSTVINANGRIDATIAANSGSAQIVLSGPLDIGSNVPGGGFAAWTGTLNVGPHALSTRYPGNARARLGDVIMSGGTITSLTAGNGYALANGDSLNGFGTINGAIQISGGAPVTATGAAGLTFNGLVTPLISPTLLMTGTAITFGSSGGFTGAGTINAIVVNQGAITATGPLVLGNGSSAGLTTVSGSMNVGIHHVTVNDSSGFSLGQCTLGGGELENAGVAPERQINTTNSHLRGFGTITAPNFFNVNSGQVSPGNPGATGTGVIIFSGNYSSVVPLNAPGRLNIDLRDSESIDQLSVVGTATLAGALSVTLANDFTPSPGTRFTFINAGSVSGTFDSLDIPPGSVIIYNPTSTQILFPCPADFNADGSVDFFDYLDFVDALSANLHSADFNGDSQIDFFDYLDFVDALSNGC